MKDSPKKSLGPTSYGVLAEIKFGGKEYAIRKLSKKVNRKVCEFLKREKNSYEKL